MHCGNPWIKRRPIARRWTIAVLTLLAFIPNAGSRGDLAGQEGKVTIRFIDNSVREGTIKAFDDVGISFQTDAASPAMRFTWDELSPEDAQRLRATLLGKRETDLPAAAALSFPATRITLKDQRIIDGIVIEVQSTDSEILIKNATMRRFIRRADIVAETAVVSPWHVLYTADEMAELLRKRLGTLETPEQYQEFGELLAKHGLPDRAKEQFFVAQMLRNPAMPENKLHQDLIRLQRRLEDVAIGNMAAEARQLHLNNRYDELLTLLDRIEQQLMTTTAGSDLLREIKRLRAEVNVLREFSRDQKIVAEWDRSADAILMTKACDRGLGVADAVSFVRNQLSAQIAQAVALKFNIGPQDPTPVIVWQRRPTALHLKMCYDNATWLVEEPDRGNRIDWWANADNAARYKLLKGIYIEKEMNVIKVFEKTCPTCGGSGVNAGWSRRAGDPASCPSCLGLKHSRCLVYR